LNVIELREKEKEKKERVVLGYSVKDTSFSKAEKYGCKCKFGDAEATVRSY
jgi:hypothetical protein